MGAINLDNTGSGGAVTLTSDGTSLLLGGSAVGGAPALYKDNASSATDPTAAGTNAVAIGSGAVAATNQSIALGLNATVGTSIRGTALGFSASATGNQATAISDSVASGGNSFAAVADAVASATDSIAIGRAATASSAYATAIGKNSSDQGSVATSGTAAMALGDSYASGANSFAAAMTNNTSTYGATGANSIAIGRRAKAAAQSAAMGYSATADGAYALALGVYAKASASSSIAISGETSGYYTEALQNNSVAIGTRAKAAIRGKFVFANGAFGDNGDAQLGIFSLRSDTTDATAEALTTNKSTAGTTNQIVLPNSSAYAFHGTIVARQKASEGTASAAWKIEGLIRREANAGTTVLVNSATTVLDNTPSWGMALTANTSHGGLAITVTGAASTNIRWVATINTSELIYA